MSPLLSQEYLLSEMESGKPRSGPRILNQRHQWTRLERSLLKGCGIEGLSWLCWRSCFSPRLQSISGIPPVLKRFLLLNLAPVTCAFDSSARVWLPLHLSRSTSEYGRFQSPSALLRRRTHSMEYSGANPPLVDTSRGAKQTKKFKGRWRHKRGGSTTLSHVIQFVLWKTLWTLKGMNCLG